MTAEEYQELQGELESLLRVYADPLKTDERVFRPLQEALEVCKVRQRDAKKERR